MNIELLSSKETNKNKDEIKIGDNYTIIVTCMNNHFIKEILCEVYFISLNENFKIKEKEPYYTGVDNDDMYYKTFRVVINNGNYGIFPGHRYILISGEFIDEITISHFENMSRKNEVMPLIMAEA